MPSYNIILPIGTQSTLYNIILRLNTTHQTLGTRKPGIRPLGPVFTFILVTNIGAINTPVHFS